MKIASRKNRFARHSPKCFTRKRGVILLIVLIIVVALSVVVYGFSRLMVIELATTNAINNQIQQELLVDSVIEQLLALERSQVSKLCLPMGEYPEKGSFNPLSDFSLTDNPNVATFGTPSMLNGPAIMAVTATMPGPAQRQFGLQNESAKLNLNSLKAKRLSRQQVVAKLMKYQDVSQTTAEGIAGVLGIFDTNGAMKQGPQSISISLALPLRSMKQLLSVPGITEEKLLGEDRNENGILDPNEDDGVLSWPPDNADGSLDAGWSAHWTLHGAESNFQDNGMLKIDLNQRDLGALYDQLLEFATPDEARFVVAWRVSSPVYTDSTDRNIEDVKRETENELSRTFEDRLANQLGTKPNSTSVDQTSSGPKIRAGISLDTTSAREVKSLLEFSSCQLQILIDGKDTILVSPFANDAASLAQWLPIWEARTRLEDGKQQIGRINILQASQSTLTTVDGISDELAKAIITQRGLIAQSRLTNDGHEKPLTIGWLLEAGLVSTSELRMISDEITVGGSVMRGYAVGQLGRSKTAAVRFIEIDTRGNRSKLLRSLELPPARQAILEIVPPSK